MAEKLKIAAVTAHPDDAEALMMGTLAKYRNQGHEVHLVIAA
jgi:LmbE family N-acetylglucosaminyl deacetylase